MAPAALQDAAVKAENSKAVKALEELMAKLTVSTAQDEINAAASAIATFINGDIEEADAPTKYVPTAPPGLLTTNPPLPGPSTC